MTINECSPFVRRVKNFYSLKPPLKAYAVDCRLIYYTDGEGTMEFDHVTYPLFKDTAILYQSGISYQAKTDSFLSFITVNFDYTQDFSAQDHYFPLQTEKREPKTAPLQQLEFTDYTALNQVIYIPNATFILEDMYKLLNAKSNSTTAYRAYSSSLLKVIICNILRSSVTTSEISNYQLEKVLSFIHDNYTEDIDNQTIASTINYHPYYVNKLISSYTGMTIHQYLNHYRLLKGAFYLRTTAKSIKEISNMVGFQNSTHFTLNFKKKFGASPTEYRTLGSQIPTTCDFL